MTDGSPQQKTMGDEHLNYRLGNEVLVSRAGSAAFSRANKEREALMANHSPPKHARPILKSRSSTTTNSALEKLPSVALRLRADKDGESLHKANRRASHVLKGNIEFSKYVKTATCNTENLMVPENGESPLKDEERTGEGGVKMNNNSFKRVEFHKV
jgi:hypothetical protein